MAFPDPVTVRPEDIEAGTLPDDVIARHLATADSGRRWVISSDNQNLIQGFSGDPAEIGPGGLEIDVPSGGRSDLSLSGTAMGGTGAALLMSTWEAASPSPDTAELRADVTMLGYTGTDRVLYDSNGRLYREDGSNLGNPYDVVLAQYLNGWANGAGSRGAWSYLGPDGFVTMGGRCSGAAINVALMTLPNGANNPGGLDHRPTEQLHFECYGNGAAVNVRIDTNGQVFQTSGVPTNLSLSNVRFPIF